jgi:hypothetical protein
MIYEGNFYATMSRADAEWCAILGRYLHALLLWRGATG